MSLTAERPLTGLSEQESVEGTIKGEQKQEREHGDRSPGTEQKPPTTGHYFLNILKPFL